MRVTRLDGCCTPPAPGAPCSQIVTDGFISTQYSPELADAEDIEQRNASGGLCVSVRGCQEVKWWNVQINICGVIPDLFEFTTGSPIVLDYAGKPVGNRVQGKIVCDTNFALETWTDLPQEACAAGQKEYGYFLLPCVANGVLGEFTIQNDALTMQINAATATLGGSGWGKGPYAVDAQDATLTPGPLLTPMGPKDHMDLHTTLIAPPDVTDGCVPMPQYDLSDLQPAS